jgi:predicted house-cleaning noncanonical NTP pyrophosphatase (MazG superfamily)
MLSAIFGIVGVVIGASIQLISTHIQTDRTISADKEARARERHQKLNDEILEFEHKNLMELQDLFVEQIRAAVQISIQDRKTLMESGQINSLPDGFGGENQRLMAKRISILIQRVLEDELREELKQFCSNPMVYGLPEYVKTFKTKGPSEALITLDQEEDQLLNSSISVMDSLGRNLRATILERTSF